MFCRQCGKENNSNDKFCKFCGAQVASDEQQATINQEQMQNSKVEQNAVRQEQNVDEFDYKKPKIKIPNYLKLIIIALLCVLGYIVYETTSTMYQEQEQMIALVTGGNLYSYSEQTIGQAFDEYFMTQEWEYFENEDGRKIVEFKTNFKRVSF